MQLYFFRKKKSLLALLLTSVLVVSAAVPASAEETDLNPILDANAILNSAPGYNWDSLANIGTGDGSYTPLDASTFYKAYNAMVAEDQSQLQFYTNAAVNNVAYLNLQYETMVASMKEQGLGSLGELTMPTINAGYSTSITDYFNDIYGDMSDRENLTASLPEGWTVSDLMEQANAKRDEALKEAKENQAYTTVKNTIALENALKQAKDAVSTPEIKSTLELSTMLKEGSKEMSKEWDAKKDSGIKWIQDLATKNEGKVNVSSKEDMQTLYENSVGETQAWLELNTSDTKNFNIQDDMLAKMQNYLKTGSWEIQPDTGTPDETTKEEDNNTQEPTKAPPYAQGRN